MANPPLRLAFCLYRYFPYGGMQRAFRRIAQRCIEQGASVTAYTLRWEGEVPQGLDVVQLPTSGVFNHTRYERYQRRLSARLSEQPVDAVVGFNKMPGLDVYYAADGCYREKALTARSRLYRSTPRFKHFLAYETAVFEAAGRAQILMSSPLQQQIYRQHYATPLERFHPLPPGIARDRMAAPNAAEQRQAKRLELGIEEREHLLLMVGSGFITKGLDRALLAVAALPEALRSNARLVVIGSDNPARFKSRAASLGIGERFAVLGGRDDIPEILQAADLLLHPAYFENTGNVLLEAMVAGLPLVTTDVCGFAHYVTDVDAGRVMPSPFRQADFNRTVADMLTAPDRSRWRANGIAFGQSADIYSLPDRAAEIILRHAQMNRASSGQKP